QPVIHPRHEPGPCKPRIEVIPEIVLIARWPREKAADQEINIDHKARREGEALHEHVRGERYRSKQQTPVVQREIPIALDKDVSERRTAIMGGDPDPAGMVRNPEPRPPH